MISNRISQVINHLQKKDEILNWSESFFFGMFSDNSLPRDPISILRVPVFDKDTVLLKLVAVV